MYVLQLHKQELSGVFKLQKYIILLTKSSYLLSNIRDKFCLEITPKNSFYIFTLKTRFASASEGLFII